MAATLEGDVIKLERTGSKQRKKPTRLDDL